MATLRRTVAALMLLGAAWVIDSRGYAQTNQTQCNAFCHGACDGACGQMGYSCAWYVSDWDGANCGCGVGCS